MKKQSRLPRARSLARHLAPGLVLAFAALLGPRAAAAQAADPDTGRAARVARAARARIRGAQTGVWVIVISDYQCPFCKKWHDETEPAIRRDYVETGKAQIAYINFPIASIHPNAQATHEVAMCAAEQDRFWPVSDALFRTQDAWKRHGNIAAYLDTLVRTLPVDKPRLDRCLQSGEMRPLIAADLDRARRLGVGSTPSFLIGGRPLIGAQPYAAFKQAIDAAIAAAAAGPSR